MFSFQRVQAIGPGLQAGVERFGGIVLLHPVGHAADRTLDAVHPALEFRVGQAHLEPGDGIFQTVQRLFVLG